METFNPDELKKLYKPSKTSHKGMNGKLTIVGGSRLFHGASLWALKVASRIVDMVFYSSILENNKLTQELKSKLYDFIAVPREKVEEYIEESDVVLIGPGLPREEGRAKGEESTRALTKRLLKRFPTKKWVIDAGSLTEMEAEWLLQLNGNVVITPHQKEFEKLFKIKLSNQPINQSTNQPIAEKAREYNCVILLKGPTDVVCPPSPASMRGELGEAGSPSQCIAVEGGNEGMTKGGTGDVLAGLVAGLACKNDLFLAAASGSFINKKAGESLYDRVGPYFNASDLADEVPVVMKELLLS